MKTYGLYLLWAILAAALFAATVAVTHHVGGHSAVQAYPNGD